MYKVFKINLTKEGKYLYKKNMKQHLRTQKKMNWKELNLHKDMDFLSVLVTAVSSIPCTVIST